MKDAAATLEQYLVHFELDTGSVTVTWIRPFYIHFRNYSVGIMGQNRAESGHMRLVHAFRNHRRINHD